MTLPVSSEVAKNTNDRSIEVPHALLRAWAWLAPGLAEEQALRWWSTPVRKPREPRVEGLVGHKFRVEGRSGRLWVWDFGVGPTVMLVHGWSGTAGQMSHFVGPLVRAGFNAVVLDLPAHGLSGGRQTNLLEMAQAIREVADKVKPVTAVVAHSLGATASALAHAQGLKVEKLALIAPPSNVPYYVRNFARLLGLPEARADGMLKRLTKRFGPLEQFDIPKLAPRFTARGLVLHAMGDKEVPFEQGEAIARSWPGARLERLTRGQPGHGTNHHWPLRDARVVEQVLEFLRPPPAVEGPRRAA